MKNKIEQVIVIGGDHYNALGVIRSLGLKKIRPIFILISNEEYNFSAKSKYAKKVYRYSEDKINDILSFLMDNDEFKKGALIIPTGDPIASFLDENYLTLSQKFILPNINEKSGEIIKCMDKLYQQKLCIDHKIPYPKSYLVDLKRDDEVYNTFPNKVIMKPVVSAKGKKADIIISTGTQQHHQSLNKFIELGYETILVQEFIEYDMEYALMGFANKDEVIIPGINSNNYIFPSNRGNTAYAKMTPLSEFKYDISNIVNMVKSLNFQGLFEIEVFLANGQIIFNEMNFRNSANCFAYLGNKVNYISLYVQSRFNVDNDDKKYVDKSFYFCIDHLHFKNIKEGTINFFQFIFHYIRSTKLIFNIRDIKPFFFRIFYAIKRRLFK